MTKGLHKKLLLLEGSMKVRGFSKDATKRFESKAAHEDPGVTMNVKGRS